MRRLSLLLVLAVASAGGASAAVQQPSSEAVAVIYRDIGFRGPAVTLTGSVADLDMQWPVRSIRVRKGVWELCTLRNFHGLCTRYAASERSIPSARAYTQSARPVSADAAD
jgi:hypothetical protein